MKKYEKFAILEQYYDACHEEAKYRGALYGDEDHILLTNAMPMQAPTRHIQGRILSVSRSNSGEAQYSS